MAPSPLLSAFAAAGRGGMLLRLARWMRKCLALPVTSTSRRPGSGTADRLKRISATTMSTTNMMRTVQPIRDRNSALVPSLGGENGITFDVYPIGGLSRNVTVQAVFLVVGCNLLVGCIRFEKCPSPSVTPQWVIGIAVFF